MINFIVKSIRMKGFRSFREPQTFQVDRKPGLYFIGGDNQDDPNLGGNGSGKSSLWDALSWCLYGKTVLGLRGKVIINWFSKTCEVSVDLFKDGNEFIITRTQNPNSLTIETSAGKETVTQADINRFMGDLDWEKFIYVLIVGQSNVTFLDLQPTDKLNLFSDIMGLSVWEQCSKTATENQQTYHKRAESLANQKGGVTPRIDGLRADLGRLQAKNEQFQQEREAKIKELDRLASEKFLELNKKEPELRLLKATKQTLTTKIQGCEDDLVRIQSNIDVVEKQIEEMVQITASDKGSISTMTGHFNKWKEIKSSICPYCEQSVPNETVTSHKQTITKELIEIKKNLKMNEDRLTTIRGHKRVNEEKAAEVELAKIGFLTQIKELEAKENALMQEQSAGVEKIRVWRQQIEDLQSAENPYSELIDACQSAISSDEHTLQDIENSITSNNRDLDGYNFWIKGFKELRLWVITDALMALEIESNNALTRLGLIDWKLKFQIERETSTGDISKGFHVLVHPKGYDGDVFFPFLTWSGGERQRLKLSGVRGLANLIQDWKGVQFNFSMWDEPSSFLSGEGIDDLIKFLHEEAEDTGKVIYFADHRHLNSSLFDEFFTVQKRSKKEGSFII